MSTKIYNGYVLPKMTMTGLLKFCMRVSEKINIIKSERYYSKYARMVAGQIDRYNLGLLTKEAYDKNYKQVSSRPYDDVFWQMNERIKKVRSTRQRDPDIDFDCNASFFPMKDKILVLFFADSRDYTACWESFEEVGDYHYQNSCDKPKTITERKWNQRRDNWDKVLGGDGNSTPRECGFSFSFASDDISYPSVEEVINKMPSLEKRLEGVSNDIYYKEYVAKQTEGQSKEEIDKNIMSLVFDFIDHVKTDEGKTRLKEISSEIEPKLYKEFTKDILFDEKIK